MAQDGGELLHADLRRAWHRFVDSTAPVRPRLFAYCRRLTGSVWDAEDLVQETLLRAFGRWGVTHPTVDNPMAYLLRTASHLWIDRIRRERRHEAAIAALAASAPQAPGAGLGADMRAAAAGLLQLAPQERAAIVLKEAFDMPLEEIADLLSTTTGAVKAALHRGRGRLCAPAKMRHAPAPAAVLDAFVSRFNDRDVPGLVALMLDGGEAVNVGNSVHAGKGADGLPHFFGKVVFGHQEWPAAVRYESARLQRLDYDDEPVLAMFVTRQGSEALMTVFRFECADGGVARVLSYGFCPDTIRALGEDLGVPVFTGLYRAPEPIHPPMQGAAPKT